MKEKKRGWEERREKGRKKVFLFSAVFSAVFSVPSSIPAETQSEPARGRRHRSCTNSLDLGFLFLFLFLLYYIYFSFGMRISPGS